VVGRVVGEDCRVIGVPEYQGELDTAAPVLGDRVAFETVLEVDGALVDIVTKGE